ncbi:MAG: HIT family protein [Nocardioidaceae bacterium]
MSERDVEGLPGCYTCRGNAAATLPARERVWRSEHWRVAHAFDSALPGWLVVVAATHVTSMDELSPAAAHELGGLLRRLSIALGDVVGCAKTYVMQFSEAEGFAHLHLHVVPRMPDQAPEHRGPRIFALLGRPDGQQVSTDERDSLAERLSDALG